jgi:hypothetical protein
MLLGIPLMTLKSLLFYIYIEHHVKLASIDHAVEIFSFFFFLISMKKFLIYDFHKNLSPTFYSLIFIPISNIFHNFFKCHFRAIWYLTKYKKIKSWRRVLRAGTSAWKETVPFKQLLQLHLVDKITLSISCWWHDLSHVMLFSSSFLSHSLNICSGHVKFHWPLIYVDFHFDNYSFDF